MSGDRPAGRRLFLALWPGEAERQALVAAYRSAIPGAAGRAVPAGNLHMTLEFLGPVAEEALPALVALGTQAALPDARLTLDRLDWWRGAATLVAAPSAAPAGLLTAQAQLRESLAAQGFRVDTRPFRPHVTLARKVAAAPSAAVLTGVEWSLGELALVESVPTPEGSRYTPLAHWPRRAATAEFAAL